MSRDDVMNPGPVAGAAPPGDAAPAAVIGGAGLVVLLIGAFIELLDVTIVTVASPQIQEKLHSSYSQVQWVLAGFQLAFAAGLITGGRLGDIYGRKKMYTRGLFGFVIASILCGLAPTAGLLIAARVLQGLTAALMYPQVLSVIQVSVPKAGRDKAYGILGAVIGISSVAGPLVGGALINANLFGWGWRLIFFVNVPIGLVTIFFAEKLVPESISPEKPKLDIVGVVLATTGLSMLLFGLIQGQAESWNWWIWLLIIGSLPVLGGFYLQQRSRQAGGSPLVDLRLFKTSTGARFGTGMIVVFVLFAGISSLFLVISVYLQTAFNFNAWHTGLAFMPIAVASMLTAGVSIPLMAKLGKRLLQIGNAIMAGGALWLIYIVAHHPTDITIVKMIPAEILLGLGLGMAVSTNNNITLAEARGPSAGSAAGVQSSVSQTGNAVGVAILGTIFFGMIASGATTAGNTVIPQLRSQLVAASVPAPVIDGVVAQFTTCLNAEAKANDPTVVPAVCKPAANSSGPQMTSAETAAITAAVEQASSNAEKHDFSTSMSKSLYYEVIVMGLSILTLFFLPLRRGRDLMELEAR